MCPWCGAADDEATPYTDFRPNAAWRRTEGASRPWTNPSPYVQVPGGSHEAIMAKDVFHLCHLGVVRTFSASLLCYLAYLGRFAAGHDFFLDESCFLLKSGRFFVDPFQPAGRKQYSSPLADCIQPLQGLLQISSWHSNAEAFHT